MKKAIKLENNYFLNLNSITTWLIADNRIQIQTGNPEQLINIEIDGDPKFCSSVSVQEFHRIVREIEEFMGVQNSYEPLKEVNEVKT